MYRGSQIYVYTRMQNLPSEPKEGKAASEYKQFDCLGTDDTLSEIGKRKRESVCRRAEVKLRLIVLRACRCGVIPLLYRNKLNVTERKEGVQGAKTPVISRQGKSAFSAYFR